MRICFKKILAVLLLVLNTAVMQAEIFRFKFKDGESYRINSLVIEDVFVNNFFSHTAEITNRITVDISDVKLESAENRLSALHTCTFMTSERNLHKTFRWGRNYESVFRRDDLGVYTIEPKYFMPVVRNVPVFPEKDLKPGDTWEFEGEEAHDLRDGFDIQTPFRVPFTVAYTYKGEIEKGGKKYHHIIAEYNLLYNVPPQLIAKNQHKLPTLYPVRTIGYSKQDLYWDNEAGNLPKYTETFKIQLMLNSGRTLTYEGTASAEITETKKLDKAAVAEDLTQKIEELGIENTTISQTDEGITISIENIQFEADSARLLSSEKEKLQKIGRLLQDFPDKELLISGHTALRGTAAERQKLSEERADSVARYLEEIGIRDTQHLYTRGFGARRPLAPNTNEENRARNRRVEITILEK
ncbi:OmpA family protein [Treponema phagedenis]|uniref:Outer membrane protein Tpn50 n=1 Tax=Treponema phagedenis TaxID=162 RepID=A0A0B7GUB0_TREPH|nr:OmpA family protein [Treponema phagedenis]QSI00582.1 OmpA family protein [Treponema phagedenis]CEM61117.1 Outer membrane protein Tpn50 [Treponema phagedenis]